VERQREAGVAPAGAGNASGVGFTGFSRGAEGRAECRSAPANTDS